METKYYNTISVTPEIMIYDINEENVDHFWIENSGFNYVDVESYEYEVIRITENGLIEFKVYMYLNKPCPSCGREDNGAWEFPCPSDDCELHQN
jgi:hypothetical protein